MLCREQRPGRRRQTGGGRGPALPAAHTRFYLPSSKRTRGFEWITALLPEGRSSPDRSCLRPGPTCVGPGSSWSSRHRITQWQALRVTSKSASLAVLPQLSKHPWLDCHRHRLLCATVLRPRLRQQRDLTDCRQAAVREQTLGTQAGKHHLGMRNPLKPQCRMLAIARLDFGLQKVSKKYVFRQYYGGELPSAFAGIRTAWRKQGLMFFLYFTFWGTKHRAP